MGAAAFLTVAGLLLVGWHTPFAIPYDEATWSKGIDCSTTPTRDLGTSRKLEGLAPWEQADHWATFIIFNGPESPVEVTLCAFDDERNRLFLHRQTLRPYDGVHRTDVDFTWTEFSLPSDHVIVVAEARGPGESAAVVAVTTFMPTCAGHGDVYLGMELLLRPTGSAADLAGSRCTMPFPLEEWSGKYDRVDYRLYDGDGSLLYADRGLIDWRPGAALAGATGVAGAVALIPRLRWTVLALFSRLRPHRLLDQNVRAQIHELVQGDPSIHMGEVARRLEIGATTAVHHLRVMVREGLLRQGARRRQPGRDGLASSVGMMAGDARIDPRDPTDGPLDRRRAPSRRGRGRATAPRVGRVVNGLPCGVTRGSPSRPGRAPLAPRCPWRRGRAGRPYASSRCLRMASYVCWIVCFPVLKMTHLAAFISLRKNVSCRAWSGARRYGLYQGSLP
ncbi:MAG: helix-turn-helix transcriptional regulator [Euryarchaeota archaeon]|nr:helix-turn-helix transcriptional regulator [Euryarchaeota archaeon]